MALITFQDVREYLLATFPPTVTDPVFKILGGEAQEPVEPERPNHSEQPMDPPRFEMSKHYHPVQGIRPNGLEGLIVHYTASPIANPGANAENVLSYGATESLHFVCIDVDGVIHVPKNWDWIKWGSHAGPSKCPVTGRTGVSRYYVGVEIVNPGVLEEGPDGFLYPWYNKKKNPYLAHWTKSQCRHVISQQDNIKPGWYLPYTDLQEEALKTLCLWLKARHPNFSFDLVLGHDEVAPARKWDPGAALSMTMPDFRAKLKNLHQ